MNNPEYCQAIYEAAKKVVDHHKQHGGNGGIFYMITMDTLIETLEKALEGKDT